MLSEHRARLLAVGPQPARILIVSDAWRPQVNGVVRTLQTLAAELAAMGHVVEVVGPDRFRTLPCPTYPDIRLSLLPKRRLGRLIEAFAPDALHIATEGPLGQAARSWALRRGCAFTTAFHTRFPEYVQARTGLSPRWLYAWLRRFHDAGQGVMVATASLREELADRGFRNIRAWSRGVDLELFRPAPAEEWGLPRPVFAYVGRVAVEKNIRAFLDLDLPGSKVVVGGGPQLSALRRHYPGVRFTGPRHGEALARAYAGSDVFVFPSLTDTFGLVILEALACGTPVAAYDVTGPKDILAAAEGRIGAVDSDLRRAALRALGADRAACRTHAERFGWRACAEAFLSHLVPLGGH
ncbi:glycosyltransferase family 4 protein [Limobrevibacterium gyesilva]|uniref:Glycosyltransferase family 1 protein n=1 Tax=Limobrevibacterium gyesilva TaxID=2991712 RepID=A0AA41YJP2_9PROT|nr:glycosyltransferase family 1 protein [Limobrevibacterium gyesilva]MCW3473347.1 glycosyltransferase family 1 protein [Limobrevibacterium gyesilva]